ncbi:type II toxin-antitoxin system RelE/ParE family toxin [Saccharophagus sp. K07]|jgi:toxin ParE1/3/4|uniref:type II toxin-antitoxin system RelE/ParE family toxin n=1 Tax=Saccharophagus sp. K07 TaxID=2283636 RepID=UPI001652167D|nr:type II toxin-antitoxin system RelE/ParE family toxin [Saccharophagus sp. K07]
MNISLLAMHPEIGWKRSEIRAGLYSLRYQSHVVFYRLLQTRIRIVRIFHQSRDLIGVLHDLNENSGDVGLLNDT